MGGHWRLLEVIGGYWRLLEVIGGYWRSLEVIRGHWSFQFFVDFLNELHLTHCVKFWTLILDEGENEDFV